MRIETGTTNERLARSGILTLALVVFAIWFAVDGWIRYPRKAVESFQTFLKLDKLPKPHPKLAYKYPKDVLGEYQRGMSKAEVLERLGEPLVIRKDPATETDHWHYVGQFGRLHLEVQRTVDPKVGQVVSAHWEETSADYRYESIQQQKFFAVICAALSVVGLIWLFKVWRTRVVVDEDGLTYDSLSIPWGDMLDLDADMYHAKGWLYLIYNAGASEKRLKLDSFKIDAYGDVIDEICRRKGFANPIPIDEIFEVPAEMPDEEDLDEDEQHRPGE